MRFPSVRLLLGEASRTLSRFPLVIATAVVSAAAALYALEDSVNAPLVRVVITAQLGIPLFFAFAMYAEKTAWPSSRRLILRLAGVGALAGYFFTLPPWMSPLTATRLVQFNVGLHLLVAILPYLRSGEINGFWQYNKSLFLRFLTAALYSSVLYVGLVIALVALDKLFGVEIEEITYARLWVVVAVVFNTWVFLGGVPRDLPALERLTDYPKGLKVFTQYILIPLVILYLTILTAYLGKVVLTRIWPSGWIGYLVSSVSAIGIFSLLLVHPIRDETQNKWVHTFGRWFYIFLFPAIAMLMLAIWKRIDQYGITENRYFLAVLALWLAAIAVYFSFSRRKNIKVIPATLCLLAFATSFGPWGAYRTSERSQVGRLERTLLQAGILAEGTVRRAPKAVSFDQRREISAILRYLAETHGVRSIEPWLGARASELDTIPRFVEAQKRGEAIDVARGIMGLMGLVYVDARSVAETAHFNYTVDPRRQVFPIGGYEYLVRRTQLSAPDTLRSRGAAYELSYDEDDQTLRLGRDGETVAEVELTPVVERMRGLEPGSFDPSSVPAELMMSESENGGARFSIRINNVSGAASGGRITIRHFAVDCFLAFE